MTSAAAEQYTIRRKFFKLFGAAFYIDDASGATIGYCKQKAFRIREDIRIYTDESCSKELIRISTKSILDISGTYEVFDSASRKVGSVRRKGLKSSFVQDEWDLAGADDRPVGTLREDSAFKGLLRRYVDLASLLLPQSYHLTTASGQELAVFRQHFNPLLFRMGVAIRDAGGPGVDDGPDELLILAAACVVAAIEGRQN